MNEPTVTMKHLPPQMQPYEKCIAYGPGFLTDAEENDLLQNEEYQRKLAKGIAEGIKKYLRSLE